MQITNEQAEKLFHETEQLKTAYQTVFANGGAWEMVQADLRRFCRADGPCWNADQRLHALLEGRREVWLRIDAQLKLTVEELLQRRVGGNYVVMKIEDGELIDG